MHFGIFVCKILMFYGLLWMAFFVVILRADGRARACMLIRSLFIIPVWISMVYYNVVVSFISTL